MKYRTFCLFFALICTLACTVLAAPVQLKKENGLLRPREYTHPQQAIHGIKGYIGSGQTGHVYDLKEKYNGHHAVIKVIDKVQTITAGNVHQEAHNLHHVGQLLGWGHDTNNGKDTHYLIMKNMGVSARQTGLDDSQIKKLNDAARIHYAAQYGMENRDINGGNFVYHKEAGHWIAEIVDWARANHAHQNVHGLHPEPVNLNGSNRRCPTCTLM